MSDFLHFLYVERLTIFLACNPFILLGIAWFVMQPRSANPLHNYGDAEYRKLARQISPLIAKIQGRAQ